MPYCIECGAEVQQGDEFCLSCGAALSDTPVAEGPSPGPTATPSAATTDSSTTPGTTTPQPQGSASDVLSRGWEFLSRNPGAFAVFGIAAVLQLFGNLVGGGVGVLFEVAAGVTVAVGSGVVILGVSRVGAGEKFDLESLVGETFDYLVAAIVAGILWVVLVSIGLMLLIVPGIYLMLRLSFTAQAVFLEGREPVEALRTSWSTTDGHLTVIFGVLAVIVLGSFVLALIPVVGRPLATLAVTPLGIASLTYLYLDVRG